MSHGIFSKPSFVNGLPLSGSNDECAADAMPNASSGERNCNIWAPKGGGLTDLIMDGAKSVIVADPIAARADKGAGCGADYWSCNTAADAAAVKYCGSAYRMGSASYNNCYRNATRVYLKAVCIPKCAGSASGQVVVANNIVAWQNDLNKALTANGYCALTADGKIGDPTKKTSKTCGAHIALRDQGKLPAGYQNLPTECAQYTPVQPSKCAAQVPAYSVPVAPKKTTPVAKEPDIIQAGIGLGNKAVGLALSVGIGILALAFMKKKGQQGMAKNPRERYLTKSEAEAHFMVDVVPMISRSDLTSPTTMRVAWNDYIEELRRVGWVSEKAAYSWVQPVWMNSAASLRRKFSDLLGWK